MWNLEELSKVPRVREVSSHGKIKGIFYEGVPFKGKETEVFAYIGIPEGKGKFPAMVLVHGGGGTAFLEWVEIWNNRGYAAISMDLCGCIPEKENGKWKKHSKGGPSGWDECFSQIDWEIKDQWIYHAIANIILSNTLLRSLPKIDENKIGITGISWGGFLTCIISGVDKRFKFAIPVYGCGFSEETIFSKYLNSMEREKKEKWLKLWDPSNYLVNTEMPMLWINGTNDIAFSLSAFQKSFNLTKGKSILSIHIRMPHSHQDGWNIEEIYTFADSFSKKGIPLPEIKNNRVEKNYAWIEFESKTKIVQVQFNFTKDEGDWINRRWETIKVRSEKNKAKIEIPDGTKSFFFNIIDERNLIVSSPYTEI